jgi:hypothetical protein
MASTSEVGHNKNLANFYSGYYILVTFNLICENLCLIRFSECTKD